MKGVFDFFTFNNYFFNQKTIGMCTSHVSTHAFKVVYMTPPSDQIYCSVISLKASPLPLPSTATCDDS